MTAIPMAPPSRHVDGASMVLIGVAGALVAVDAAAALLVGGGDALAAALFTLAMAAMVVAGGVLVRDHQHDGLGRLLLGVAASGSLLDLLGWIPDAGPADFLRNVLYWPYAGLLAHLAVRWPDRALTGAIPRALVAAMYGVMPLLTLLWQLTWDPAWFGGAAARRFWITLAPARGLSGSVWAVQQLLLVALIAALVAVVAVRVATARGPRRVAMAPVAVVSIALGATVVLEVLQGLGTAVPVDTGVLQSVALLAVPVAVLLAALQAPAGIDEPVMPGRRRLDERARGRYRVGLAAGAAALVVLVAVCGVWSAGGWDDAPAADTGPAPQPGPALVAPEAG